MFFVKLVGYYGGDEAHAASAWTSTSTELDVKRIPKLLKHLAKNGHGTPFEKSLIHFIIRVDQATHIHFLKHRIGVSINGESARYREIVSDDCLTPNDWPLELQVLLRQHTRQGNALYHQVRAELVESLGAKRANESARYFRTMNTFTTLDVTFNFRSFVHFYGLRAATDAQLEIRHVAARMLDLVVHATNGAFKHSLSAFGLTDHYGIFDDVKRDTTTQGYVRDDRQELPGVCGQVCHCGVPRRVCQGEQYNETRDETQSASDSQERHGLCETVNEA
jgi:flavin-dependent thymidylate synthase